MNLWRRFMAWFKRTFWRELEPIKPAASAPVSHKIEAPLPKPDDPKKAEHERLDKRLKRWMQRHPQAMRMQDGGFFLQVKHFGTYSRLKPLSGKSVV